MPMSWIDAIREAYDVQEAEHDLPEEIVKEITRLEQKEKTQQQTTAYSYEGQTPPKILDHISAAQWARTGVWASAKSSNVARIKYDQRYQDLYVEWVSGGVGYFLGVEPHTVMEFFNSNSLGRFVHARLTRGYSYRKIR